MEGKNWERVVKNNFFFRDPLLCELMVTVRERLDQMEEDEEDMDGESEEEDEESDEEEDHDDGDDEDDSSAEEDGEGGHVGSNDETTDSGICISE